MSIVVTLLIYYLTVIILSINGLAVWNAFAPTLDTQRPGTKRNCLWIYAFYSCAAANGCSRNIKSNTSIFLTKDYRKHLFHGCIFTAIFLWGNALKEDNHVDHLIYNIILWLPSAKVMDWFTSILTGFPAFIAAVKLAHRSDSTPLQQKQPF